MRQSQLPPIAIVGMAGIFPKARNLQEYWQNILDKVDCITDVPETHWNTDDYYDPDPNARDKVYCMRGGFLPNIDFDPLEFGLPPNALECTDVSQLLALVVARQALEDAGYGEDRAFARERTGVILGVSGGQKLITPLTTRLQYPVWKKALISSGISETDADTIVEKIKSAYVGWEENSFPGLLGNVIAGRITNRLNLGGTNCVVDAACASSLGALKMALSELTEGRCDMMIAGGVDTDNSVFTYMCFSKTPAFSASDKPRPFDRDGDGMMVGEGLGMIVLKRLEDAERDQDRIYAVIRGIGTSSDGKHKSIYAPHSAGQARALRTAYENAGFTPDTVGLIEAHGTGTVVGDITEFTSLRTVFNEHTSAQQAIALGSIKSQIGHTKAAAGAASMIKTALALHHKVLPPTMNITEPHEKFAIDDSPFYLNTESRPWIRTEQAPPRRAGVSSFGFGGTNFHVVLEEYQPEHQSAYRLHRASHPVVIAAEHPTALRERCESIAAGLQSDQAAQQYTALLEEVKTAHIPLPYARVGFVAATLEETREMLQLAINGLQKQPQAETWQHPRGVFYRQQGLSLQGRVVALFAGQGSQYLDMGRELLLNFPILRHAYAYIDSLFEQDNQPSLSSVVFPRPVFSAEQRNQHAQALQQTRYAQPAIGVFSACLYKMLQQTGFRPDFTAGHSFGELTALWAAGAMNDADYFALVRARGQAMSPLTDRDFDAGTMLAVSGDLRNLQADIQAFAGVTIANLNSPRQMVLAGPTEAVHQAHQALRNKGYNSDLLPVSAAFHTSLVGHAQQPFAQAIARAHFQSPTIPVYSNASAQPYPSDPVAIQHMLAQHILQPVLFQQQIEQIYQTGGFCFVEFGPRSILTNLVHDILGDRPHIALSVNASRQKDSDRQLSEALVQLRVAGLSLSTIDTYGLEPISATSRKRKGKGMAIPLNGSNYVSPKTREAFARSLQDGFTITPPSVPVSPANPTQKTETVVETPIVMMDSVIQPVDSISQRSETLPMSNNTAMQNGPASLGPDAHTIPIQSAHHAQHTHHSVDQQALLGVFERGMNHFSDHQRETLKVHEQYLNHQAEFFRTFFQFMHQQQSMLLGQPQQGVPSGVLENLSHSASLLHHHQSETLRVHEQYLERQTEHSRLFFQMIQDHHHTLLGTTSQTPLRSVAEPPQIVALSSLPIATQTEAPVHGDGSTNGKHDQTAPVIPVVEPQPVQDAHQVSTNGDHTTSLEASESNGQKSPSFSFDTLIAPGVAQRAAPLQPPVHSQPVAPAQPPVSPVLTTPLEPIKLPTVMPHVPAVAPDPVMATPTGATGISAAQVNQALLEIVSEKTGYPVEMLEAEMDIEADLGIDSIKRVEILGAMQDRFADLPRLTPEELAELRTLDQISTHLSRSLQPVAVNFSGGDTLPAVLPPTTPVSAPVALATPAPTMPVSIPEMHSPLTEPAYGSNGVAVAVPAISSVDVEMLHIALLEIVSEKTGYPVDMLEPEMDIEADLGIDSIKRVEIMGALQDQFPAIPRLKPEELAELRTLDQISNHMSHVISNGHQSSAALPDVVSHATPESHGVPRKIANLQPLNAPDFLEIPQQSGHICLVTDDGTPLIAKLVTLLTQRGWRVVVLSLPTSLIPTQQPLPAGTPRVSLPDLEEARLPETLAAVTQTYGPVGAFIHLNPPMTQPQPSGGLFSETEKVVVRHVFLLAKYLKQPLHTAAQQGQGRFVTVARLDGQFGLGQQMDFGAIGGGLFGLTKTLNLEWGPVFCRAVDLSIDMKLDEAARSIMAELHDPNRLITEVGYGSQGRVTLVGI
ncbi:MAG: acyltransferase domain-containing protein [Chloroflexaceae bacterium]|nr:acyltransferase domain-containing protein [Chloroflexaceae bacterium]